MPRIRPAEINMAPYRTVAVAGMNGNGERALAASLEEALVGSQRFEVVDRQRLDGLLHEVRLSRGDLADPARAAKLGQLLVASALIAGDATEDYRESRSDERVKGEKSESATVRRLTGELMLRANFRVVDVATGRLVVAKTYVERRADTAQALDAQPQPIDRAALALSARQAVVERFMKAIVPHQEFVTANFLKDSDLPQLEAGIGWAERGEWKKAQESFAATVEKATQSGKSKKSVAKGYFDLALAHEYAGDYDEAARLIDRAVTLSDDREYLRELESIRRY